MVLIEVICVAVPIGLIVGAAVALGAAKLLKRERQSLKFVSSPFMHDAEPYPRAWE
ncbi:hypothetical protein [Paraburkholderia bannensis]|uniref:hypothetical protein n=1 Tax=Paraburkholderia bannensis TaxID=765414 RepID=UPI0012EC46B5|nr:hypothetical protein [Paraburkholderia bannensis]